MGDQLVTSTIVNLWSLYQTKQNLATLQERRTSGGRMKTYLKYFLKYFTLNWEFIVKNFQELNLQTDLIFLLIE